MKNFRVKQETKLHTQEEEMEKKRNIGLTTKGGNRGYGRYLINRALKELGVSVEVSFEKGNGTEFNVKIP